MKLYDVLKRYTTICVLGQKGSGKTYATAIMANIYDGKLLAVDMVGAWTKKRLIQNAVYLRIGVIPPEELVKNLDEQFQKASRVVCDLSYLINKEKVYIMDILSMYAISRGNMAVFVDEAAFVVPQGRESYSYEFDRLVMAGRNFGIQPVVFISQRPQRINKDVLALADYYVFFRLLHPLDRVKVKDIVGLEKEEWEKFEKQLMGLNTREAFVFDASSLQLKPVIFPEVK